MKLIFCPGLLATITLLSAVLLSACSSHIPPEIGQSLDNSPGMEQVREQADTYISEKVRWGGVILHTENKQNASWITIIAFPLDNSGEPRITDQSPGRFIAIVDKFLEPLVYSLDREITVTGSVLRTETIKVGEFPHKHPVIQVENHHLWPVRPEQPYADYPLYWLYDPYYPWNHPHYPHYRH
jgi:outer membrane lipoprotein